MNIKEFYDSSLLGHHIKLAITTDIQHTPECTYITFVCQGWHFSETRDHKLAVSGIRGLVWAGKIFINLGVYKILKLCKKTNKISLEFHTNKIYLLNFHLYDVLHCTAAKMRDAAK
jgi:hypothetical protein